MQTLASKARQARRMTRTEREDIRQYRKHVSVTFIKSEMAETPTKTVRFSRQAASKLVILPGETPQQAYLRMKEERLKSQNG
jgi:hypothetical protein